MKVKEKIYFLYLIMAETIWECVSQGEQFTQEFKVLKKKIREFIPTLSRFDDFVTWNIGDSNWDQSEQTEKLIDDIISWKFSDGSKHPMYVKLFNNLLLENPWFQDLYTRYLDLRDTSSPNSTAQALADCLNEVTKWQKTSE